MRINLFILVLCLLSITPQASGKIYPATQPLTISVNNTVVIQEYHAVDAPDINTPKVFVKRKMKWIELEMNRITTNLPAFTYSVNLELKIMNGSTTIQTENIKLTLNYDPQNPYNNNVSYALSEAVLMNGDRLSIKVLPISNPNGIPVSNFSLRYRHELEYYYKEHVVQSEPINNLSFNTAEVSSKGILEMNWASATWAEGYDLEYLYINNYDENGGVIGKADLTLDERAFQFNSTRVHVSTNKYSIPLIYDKGYLVYRVRGYMRTNLNGDNYETTIPGTWTVNAQTPVTVATFGTASYEITVGHSNNINWQSTRTFAEEGKSQTQITYYDGSLRSRQEISSSQLGSYIVVGETVYDLEGRPAIKVLPTPKKNASMRFIPGLNLSTSFSGKAYSKYDFDLSTENCSIGSNPLSSANGSGQYYSPNNELLLPANSPAVRRIASMIPDAEGYPIVQTRYTRDNTGKISAQSAPGIQFQLGTNKETKYFYGRPDQIELDRLFGGDAGYAEHYKKNVVRDPNGQLSISYLDLNDKVVATSLVGAIPTNVEQLPNMGDITPMKVDLLNKINPSHLSGVENRLDFSNASKTLEYKMVVTDESIRSFYYEVQNNNFTPGCIDPLNPSQGSGSQPAKPSTALNSSAFSSAVGYPQGFASSAFAVADVSGDGLEDIIAVSSTLTTNNIKININQLPANPTNGFVGQLITGPIGIKQVEVADMDFDGLQDLVLLTSNVTKTVVILKNTTFNGVVSFTEISTYDFPGTIAALALSDLDKNGYPDIVLAQNHTTSRLLVLKNIINTASAKFFVDFEAPIAINTFNNQGKMTTGDVNGDGLEDILVINGNNQSVVVFANQTSGSTLAFASGVAIQAPASTTLNEVCLADITYDGKLDIVMALSGSNGIATFSNTSSSGTISFNLIASYLTGGAVAVDARDLNKDGFMDISVLYPNGVTIMAGQYTGFTTQTLSTGGSPAYADLKCLDLNHDGKLDLVMQPTATQQIDFRKNQLTGIPACYECVLDLSVSLRPTESCDQEYLAGINNANLQQTTVTIGPLEAITNNPSFFPLHNCNPTATVFKRGNDESRNPSGTIWNTNTYSSGTQSIMDQILPVGTYYLTKVLKVNRQALDIYADNYLTQNTCLKSLADFEQEEMGKLDFSLCDITCAQRKAKLEALRPTQGCTNCLTQAQYDEFEALYLTECENNDIASCKAELELMLIDMSPSGQYGEVFNQPGIQSDVIQPFVPQEYKPTLFPVSVFNDFNVLPGKNRWYDKYQTVFTDLFGSNNYGYRWVPSWRYPIRNTATATNPNLTPVESDFSYVDENGNVEYIILTYRDGIYYPEVDASCTQYIKKEGDVFKVQPQYLKHVNDFLKYWKPSWAQSLVVYHPEFPYYELCIQNSVFNEWDLKIGNIELVSATVESGSALTTQNFLGPAASTWGRVDAVNQLLDLDPYFNFTINQNTSIQEREVMRNRLLNYASNESGQSHSIWDLAYKMVHCPSTFQNTNCPCEIGTEGLGVNTDLNIQNKEWEAFRSLYLSLKQEFIREKRKRTAIKDGFYNGCISKQPFSTTQDNFYTADYIATGIYTSVNPWLAYNYINVDQFSQIPFLKMVGGLPSSSQLYNLEQPCYVERFKEFQGKMPRFPSSIDEFTNTRDIDCERALAIIPNASFPDFDLPNCKKRAEDILHKLQNRVEATVMENCKQCPVAQHFMGLLTNLQNAKVLVPTVGNTTTIPLFACNNQGYEGFSDELVKQILKGVSAPLLSCSLIVTINPSGPTTPETVLLKFVSTASGASIDDIEMTVELPIVNGVKYKLEDIRDFCCLQGVEKYNGKFNYLFTATVPLKQGDPNYIAQLELHPDARPQLTQIKVRITNANIDLANCLPEENCQTTEVANSLLNVLNGLAFADKLHSSGNFTGGVFTQRSGSVSDPWVHVNSSIASPYYGTFTEDIKAYLKLDYISALTDKVYWISQIDGSTGDLVGYFYNNMNFPGMPPTAASITTTSDLNSLEVCSLRLSFNYLTIPFPVSPFSYQDIVKLQNIKGDGNTFSALALVKIQRPPSTVYEYMYIPVTGSSPCFEFAKCSDRLFGFDETGAQYECSSTSSAFFKIPEVGDESPICPSCSASTTQGTQIKICWEDYFKRINFLLRDVLLRSDHRPDRVMPEITHLVFENFAIDKSYPSQGCTDCSFEIYGNSTGVLSDIEEVIGVSRVFGSNSLIEIMVRMKSTGKIRKLTGIIGLVDPSGRVVPNIACSYEPIIPTRENTGPICSDCGKRLNAELDFGINYGTCTCHNKFYQYTSSLRPFETDLLPGWIFTPNDQNPEVNDTIAIIRQDGSLIDRLSNLPDNQYGILLSAYTRASFKECRSPYKMYFKLAPSQSFTTIWRNKSAYNSTVSANENHFIRFIIERDPDFNALPIPATGKPNLTFDLEVLINGVVYQVNRGTRISDYGMMYEIDWNSGSVTSVQLEIRLRNTTNVTGAYSLAAIEIEPDCRKTNCCPIPEKTIEAASPCKASLISIAQNNAKIRYTSYIKEVRRIFEEQYISKCLNVYEDFFMKYNNSEDHFTLYYYDRSGNLIRTIPPNGVVPLNPNNSQDATKLAQIKFDRDAGRKTVFTNHTMATTYRYNSLNQLQYQSNPDQVDLNIFNAPQYPFPVQQNASTQVINDMEFVNGNTAIAIGENGGSGQVFKTTNAGQNWSEMNVLNSADLLDIKEIFYWKTIGGNQVLKTIRFAVGKNGSLLESNPDIQSGEWRLMQLPTKEACFRIIPIVTTTTATVTVYTKSGSAFTRDLSSNSENWSVPSNALGYLFKTTIADVAFKPSSYLKASDGNERVGYAVSEDGRVAQTLDGGASWKQVLSNNASISIWSDHHVISAVQIWDNQNAYVGGAFGLMMKGKVSQGDPLTGAEWTLMPSNIQTRIRKISFVSEQVGLVLAENGSVQDLYFTSTGMKGFSQKLRNVKDIHRMQQHVYALVQATPTAGPYSVYYSANDGKDWTLLNAPTWAQNPVSITSVFISGNSTTQRRYVIVGCENKTLLYGELNASNNVTWNSVIVSAMPSALTIAQVSASYSRNTTTSTDELRIFARGTNGVIYKTDNIITSSAWTVLNWSALKTHFKTNTHGFMLHDNQISATGDGGKTWNIIDHALPVFSSNFVDFDATTDAKGIFTTISGGLFVREQIWNNHFAWSEQQHSFRLPEATAVAVTDKGVMISGTSGYWIYHNGTADFSDQDYKKWWIMPSQFKGSIQGLEGRSHADREQFIGVGDLGNIINTDVFNFDLYATTKSNFIAPRTLNAVAWNGNDIVACGENGMVVSGTFASPALTYAGAANAKTLFAVAVVDNQFHAVGEQGVVIRRTMPSATWVRTASIAPFGLKSVDMVDANIGFAVGNNGNILKTTDGGETWRFLAGIGTTQWNTVAFADPSIGFVAGKGGKILKTTDGGQTWVLSTVGSADLNDVLCFSTQIAYVGGNNKSLYYTLNGGTSWSTVNLSGYGPSSAPILSMTSPDATMMYVSGGSGMILKITDPTVAPTITVSPSVTPAGPYTAPSGILSRIHFRDRLIGYAIGENNRLFKTVDGGNNWRLITLPGTGSSLQTLGVIDVNNYLITGTKAGGGTFQSFVYDLSNEFSTRFYYDQLGRLVASQNSKQYAVSPYRYSYTRYDYKGRITEVGEIDARIPIEAAQSATARPKVNLHLGSGVWDMSSWTADAGTTLSFTAQSELRIQTPTCNKGASMQFNSEPGKVYRIRYRIAASTMTDYKINVYDASVTAGELLISQPSYSVQNGLSRELMFTAKSHITWISFVKACPVAANITSQTLDISYLTLEESGAAFGYMTCTELNLFKQFYTYLGNPTADLSDPVKMNLALKPYYKPEQTGADIVLAFQTCANTSGIVTKVLPVAQRPASQSNNLNGFYVEDWLELNQIFKHSVTQTYYDVPALSSRLPDDFEQVNLRNRVASSVTIAQFTNSAEPTYEHGMHYSYDIHGNVNELLIENTRMKLDGVVQPASMLVAEEQQFKRIKYAYDLISGKVNNVAYQEGKPDQFFHNYTYDQENKLVKVETSVDGRLWDVDAKYDYYLHGPLARVEMGDDLIQGMDYAYTLQGWLKVVNSSALATPTRDIGLDNVAGDPVQRDHFGRDEIGYSLGYFSNDFTPIGRNLPGFTNPVVNTTNSDMENTATTTLGLYNGNISHMVTSVRHLMMGKPLGTTYSYDQLNRIIAAKYRTNVNMQTNQWEYGAAGLADHKNMFSYDENGNILTQVRNGEGANRGVEMDNLSYEYYSGTNKLKRVEDAVAKNNYPDDIDHQTEVENYVYDEIGNLIQDKAEEIQKIEWSVYGKITSIVRNAGSDKPDLYFEYGPDGNRVMKMVVYKAPNQLPVSTYYVRDAQGNIMATYTKTLNKDINYNTLQFSTVGNRIISAEGASVWEGIQGAINGDQTGLQTAILNHMQTQFTDAQKQTFLSSNLSPYPYFNDHTKLAVQKLLLNKNLADVLSSYIDYHNSNCYSADCLWDEAYLCKENNCAQTIPDNNLLAELLMNGESRALLLEALYHAVDKTEVENILSAAGCNTGSINDDLNCIRTAGVLSYNTTSWDTYAQLITPFINNLQCQELKQVLNYFIPDRIPDLVTLLSKVPALRARPIIEYLDDNGLNNFGINMSEWMASTNNDRRAYFMRGLYFYLKQTDPNTLDLIMSNFGTSPTTDEAFIDYMMNSYGGSDSDIKSILENYGIIAGQGSGSTFARIMATVQALMDESSYTALITSHPKYTEILTQTGFSSSYLASEAYGCLNMFRNGFTIEKIYNDLGMTPGQVWTDIWSVDRNYQAQLELMMNLQSNTFISRFAALYPSQFMSLQQSTANIYGNGIEGYFARIQAAGYGAVYNRLVEHFSIQSSTYLEALSVDDWVVYGSSRLATYNVPKLLLKAKFDANLNGRVFTNINQLSFVTGDPISAQWYATTRGYKYFELSNHLGNVLAVVSDRKVLGTPTVPYNEQFNRIQFTNPGQYAIGRWTMTNAMVVNTSGVLKIEDNPATTTLIPEVGYVFTGSQRPRNGRTYRISLSLSRIKTTGTGTWTLIVEDNGTKTYPLALGNNTINNVIPTGDIWRMRLVYSVAGQDIDFRVDNILIQDMTSGTTMAYNAQVMQAAHYSPFGAPMADLSYDRSKEQVNKVIDSDDFASSLNGWRILPNHASVTLDAGRMRVTGTSIWAAAQKVYVNIKEGAQYVLRFQLDIGTANGFINVPVYNRPITALSPNWVSTNKSGEYVYRFKAIDDTIRVIFELTPNVTPGSVIWVDNVTLEEEVIAPTAYRFGFNGKENIDEVVGSGNWQDYGERMYSPRLGRFPSVDPLTREYTELSPYQFASNTPIQAIDQDGLEAFIVHGTQQTQTGVNFTAGAVSQFKRITGNTVSDDKFRWNAPIYNDSKMRKVAAEQLVNHIVETRAKLMTSGQITENESVSLIGYSHGGNVSIQAAQMLNDKYGIKVNLITVGTPAKNSAFDTDADNMIFGNPEDPQGNSGINSHFHIRHVNDGVWGIANAAGDKSDAVYSNPGITRNWDIPNSSIDLPGPVESHTDLPSHAKFGSVLRSVPKMPAAPAAGTLE